MPSSAATNLLELERRTRDFPLFRAPAHYTVRERWLESYDTYARVTPDTAHASPFGAARLVDEVTLEDLENLKRYERLWSTIPESWTEVMSEPYDYPAFLGAWANPGSVISASVTAAVNASSARLVITKSSHGLTSSNYVRIKYSHAYNSGLATYSDYITKILSTTTDTFTIGAMFFGTAGSWSFSSVSYRTTDGTYSRSLRTEEANKRFFHEYALPGVTAGVSTSDDFQPLRPLQYVDAIGETVVLLTAATIPTNTEWVTAALAGSYFIERSTVKPYLGNILERVTVSAPYRL